MTFTVEEARAGLRRAKEDLRRAEEALSNARGRHERREAQARVEQARTSLDIIETVSNKLEKQQSVRRTVAAQQRPEPPRPPARPTPCSKSTALDLVGAFGKQRSQDGDAFFTSPAGYFFYATGAARVGIGVWGDEDDWGLSIYSAARVAITPSLDLYRFVSRWRTTAGLGAPYVVEHGGRAAIMCERLFQSSQLPLDVFPYVIPSTIDLIGSTAQQIAQFLQYADGAPFTGEGVNGLLELTALWEVNDSAIESFVKSVSI